MFCHDPDAALFNGVPADVAATYQARLQHQPGGGWDGVIQYAGWEKIPSAFLVCEKDACLPPALQRRMAEAAKCRILTVDVGHMAMLAAPDEVAGKLLAFIQA